MACEEGIDPCVTLSEQRRADRVGEAAPHADAGGGRIEQAVLQPVPVIGYIARSCSPCRDVEDKLARPLASWRSGGLSQRQIVPQAASSSGQPWPISRLEPRWPATPALVSDMVPVQRGQSVAVRLCAVLRVATQRAEAGAGRVEHLVGVRVGVRVKVSSRGQD